MKQIIKFPAKVLEPVRLYLKDREKRLKKWCRKWKLKLIEKSNPNWNDLYTDLI